MKKRAIAIYGILPICLFIISLNSCKPQTKEDEHSVASSTETLINLEEISITDLQDGYKQGKYSIKTVVQNYLNRINELDKNGPKLSSVIEVNPDAIQIAEELDKELAAGKSRGPLHGIPILLKDNIDTHDKMHTTAGATVLRNSIPLQDSWVAKKLREAGAVIIGKTNLSEWAHFRAQLATSGWSGLGGQTKNPYVLDRNPCGSSSGSGVAVAANLCALAIGTETDGSIVCPSNNNGIVGLKPTVGLISRAGIIPISFTQDTPGPMGRTVRDVAICLGALTGVDAADSKTAASTGNIQTDYTTFLKTDGLKGKRIGLLKNTTGFHPKVDVLLNKAIEDLKAQGAEIVDIQFPLDGTVYNSSFEVMLYEFKDGLNNYFKTLGKDVPVKTLKELIEFNKKDSIELKLFNQNFLEMAESKGDLQSEAYKKALSTMLKATRENGIDKFLKENKLDALIAPTGGPAWKIDHTNGDLFLGSSSSYAAISGYPDISVPMGFIDDLPVGISFFGKAWSEPILLEIAYAYEQATKHRKAPKYIISN